MKKAILATKVGMTQIFNEEDGVLIPVTVLQACPCVVTQVKTVENDGYKAVQVGFVDKREKLVSKPVKGHFDKAGVSYKRFVREFRFENAEEYSVKDEIKADIFAAGDKIDATGTGGAQWCKTITKTSENFSCALGALTCSADISDAAKAVLRAYGLLPVDGAKASDYDDDRLWFNNVADERLFSSGGHYGFGTSAGVGFGSWTSRGYVYVSVGWRSAYVDLESVGL